MIAILTALALAGVQAAAPAAPPPPSPEAEALGTEVARNGFLATMMPMITAREIEELIDAHPELTAADKDMLRATGKAEMQAALDKATAAMGHQYAVSMSVADLKALVAFFASPAAKSWHAAEPGVVMATAKIIDKFDFKGSVTADFCKKTGKLCADTAKK